MTEISKDPLNVAGPLRSRLVRALARLLLAQSKAEQRVAHLRRISG